MGLLSGRKLYRKILFVQGKVIQSDDIDNIF